MPQSPDTIHTAALAARNTILWICIDECCRLIVYIVNRTIWTIFFCMTTILWVILFMGQVRGSVWIGNIYEIQSCCKFEIQVWLTVRSKSKGIIVGEQSSAMWGHFNSGKVSNHVHQLHGHSCQMGINEMAEKQIYMTYWSMNIVDNMQCVA